MKLAAPGGSLSDFELLQVALFSPFLQRNFEFELTIEMVLDDLLVASGDEHEMLDPGLSGLIDRILDERSIDHRQHLFWDGLGGGEEPGAESGDREDGSSDGFRHS